MAGGTPPWQACGCPQPDPPPTCCPPLPTPACSLQRQRPLPRGAALAARAGGGGGGPGRAAARLPPHPAAGRRGAVRQPAQGAPGRRSPRGVCGHTWCTTFSTLQAMPMPPIPPPSASLLPQVGGYLVEVPAEAAQRAPKDWQKVGGRARSAGGRCRPARVGRRAPRPSRRPQRRQPARPPCRARASPAAPPMPPRRAGQCHQKGGSLPATRGGDGPEAP